MIPKQCMPPAPHLSNGAQTSGIPKFSFVSMDLKCLATGLWIGDN